MATTTVECGGVVWDHDDTGIVTRQTEYARMQDVGRMFGLEITKEELDESWGLPFEKQLVALYGTEFAVEVLSGAYESLGADYPRVANEGYIKLLDKLEAAGILFGMVTSHNGALAREESRQIGADPERFLFFHGSEETAPYHKPDPRVFDRAAELFEEVGVSRSQTVVIGDDVRDLKAAKGAGMGFIGVTTGIHTVGAFAEEGAEVIVPRLSKIGVAAGQLVIPRPSYII